MENEDDIVADLKPLDAKVDGTQVIDQVNRHVVAIRQVNGDQQRLGERIERTMAEMAPLLRAHKEGASVQVVPQGDAAELDRRFLLPDGSVRFRGSDVEIPLPDGTTHSHRMPGLLTDASVTPEHEALRRAYGAYAIAYARVRAKGRAWDDLLVKRAYVGFRAALQGLPGRVGDFCRRLVNDPETFKRVISSTAGSGGELIAVPTTSNVIRSYDLARRIPGMVRMLPAPAPSFKQPIVTGRGLGRKRGATQSDPARYPVQSFSTSDRTLSVWDMVIMALIDPLWVTDSSAVLADPMGLVMDWLARAYADTLEAAFLHGDTAGTHEDAIASWTMGSYFTAGQLDGSDSPLKAWIGWRARAFDDSNTTDAGGTWDPSDHFAAIQLLGTHAKGRVVSFCGLKTLYTQLLGNSNFLTVQNYGALATIITGEIGSIGGVPVVISEFQPSDLASTGLYTGSGSSGSIVYVDLDAWSYYEMAGGDDFDAMYPERGAQYVGMVRRGTLAPDCLSTEKPVSILRNV